MVSEIGTDFPIKVAIAHFPHLGHKLWDLLLWLKGGQYKAVWGRGLLRFWPSTNWERRRRRETFDFPQILGMCKYVLQKALSGIASEGCSFVYVGWHPLFSTIFFLLFLRPFLPFFRKLQQLKEYFYAEEEFFSYKETLVCSKNIIFVEFLTSFLKAPLCRIRLKNETTPSFPPFLFLCFLPRVSCMQQEGTCKGKEREWASSNNNEKSGDGNGKYFPRSFFPIPSIFNFRKIFCQSSNFSSLKSKIHTQQAREKENEESNAQVLWPEREGGGANSQILTPNNSPFDKSWKIL